jgi:hypothetical protein
MPHKNPEAGKLYRKLYRLRNRKRIDERVRLWRLKNPEKSKLIAARSAKKNRKQSKITQRRWRALNRDRINAQRRARRQPDKERVRTKAWKVINRDKIRSYDRAKRSEPSFRLAKNLRCRVNHALKRNSKSAPTIALLGCSIEDFWIYLESRFEVGMTRENYGKVWEVDHIIPCAIFDLSKIEHQRRCFHFSNLQPLFALKNRSKGKTYVGSTERDL